MTEQELRRAFDALRPDEVSRERMLQGIQAGRTGTAAPRRPAARRWLVVTAVLVLLLAFASVSYAADLWGLRTIVLYHHEADDTTPYSETDILSLQGVAGSPEFQANARWQEFYRTYDPDGMILAAVGNGDTGLPSRYDNYPCYTQAMADMLDTIAAENGLALLSGLTTYGTQAEMPGWLVDILPRSCDGYDHLTEGGYAYDGGSFMVEGVFTFHGGVWPYSSSYQFNCCRKGYLSVSYLPIGDAAAYTQWTYETASGVTVMLALSRDKALIVADLPEAYLVVNVLEVRWGDAQSGEQAMPPTTLEQIADAFRFDLVECRAG